MYTSYSIEKVAAGNRRDALAAAEQARLVREVRSTVPPPTGPTTVGAPVRISRQHWWFGMSAVGR